MHWPPDHPVLTDRALARWREGAERLCPDATAVRVLRHLPDRRVTTLVQLRGGLAVLKVFATPRAGDNHRRLTALATVGAAGLVPRSLGADDSGHVGLIELVPGTPLDEVSDEQLASCAERAGDALRRLHGSGARLDRSWTIVDEQRQLRRTAGRSTRAAAEDAIGRWAPRAGTLVPSHRDCYPAQAIANQGEVRFIDLDDAAMAPPGLDTGNFLAHLLKDALVGLRPWPHSMRAMDAFLEGYGGAPAGLGAWARLSLMRLAALAETRHRDPEQAQRLLDANYDWRHAG
ncbi:MAG: hypothetical protein NVSMB25_13300 [Thermoleophilaceae bacterium]